MNETEALMLACKAGGTLFLCDPEPLLITEAWGEYAKYTACRYCPTFSMLKMNFQYAEYGKFPLAEKHFQLSNLSSLTA